MKRFTKFATALSTAFLMAAVLATGASAHDNGAAQTPPMGWSSWNLFAANIDEDLIVDIADAMVEYNLDDAGYEYVNLDDNWQSSERDVNGRLQFDPIRFPHDGNWLSNEIHDRGLKMGLYTSNGLYTCQDLPASEFRELSDATSFANWEIDFFKYDYCHNVQLSPTAYGIYGLDVAKPYAPGTEVYEYSYRDAELEGTAYISGDHIDGLGENAGAATFTVTVPEDGTYAINLDFYKKPSSEDVPMFVDINGDSAHPYRMMLPASNYTGGAPGSRASALFELKAGENTLRFYNPIRSSNRDYDTARYNYKFMSTNLMQATEKYAEENGKENRPITLEICEWGGRQPWVWGGETGNMWRTTGDIAANWNSISSIYDTNVELYKYAGKYGKEEGDNNYGWNHPDMLEVGVGSSLTYDEYVSHFSLWCQMASPLILGNDLRTLDEHPEILEIITNEDAIAVDQDPTAIQGIRYRDEGDFEYLVKPLTDGRISLLMFNRSNSAATMTQEISQIGELLKEKDEYYYDNYYKLDNTYVYHLKDVWEKDEDGNNIEFDSPVASASVPAHGVKMYIIEPNENVQEGAYIVGELDDSNLRSGESAILTARFVNGGATKVDTVGISLELPEGFTSKALSSTVSSDLTTGESFTVQFRVTAGDVPMTNEPITVKALLTYEGSNQPVTVTFDTMITVQAAATGDPLPDGPLTTENWVSGTAGWGNIQQDRSINGNPLTINGTTYETGIGTHAPSELVYYIGGRNVEFTALVGSDADSGNSGDITFQVYGDDDLLYDSGEMDWHDDAKSVAVKLMGYDYLRLVVDSGGNMDFDHADWINPRIDSYDPEVLADDVLTIANAWSANSYWRDPADGKNMDGGSMILDGVNYDRPDGGFQVNPPSEVVYYLNGASGVFTTKIGIGDEVEDDANGATVNYKIYGDDELLFEQYMDATSESVDVELPMAGYDFLKLVVEEVDSTEYDHACWVEPRFTTSTEPLAALIAEAEELFNTTDNVTDEAIELLQNAIDEAQALVDLGSEANKDDMALAAKQLRVAMQEFTDSKWVVDKAGLYGAIIMAKSLNEEDYDADKWAAFEEVYDAAYEVYLDEEATQEDVNAAEQALRDALKSLDVVAGDLDGDGELTDADIEMLQQYILGDLELTEDQMALMDYDGNGTVDIRDMIQWKKVLLTQA